jgi:hypothetical protein
VHAEPQTCAPPFRIDAHMKPMDEMELHDCGQDPTARGLVFGTTWRVGEQR